MVGVSEVSMMSEMDQARIKGTYLDYINHMSRLDMLVIDDFGLMDLDIDKCRDFFEVCKFIRR